MEMLLSACPKPSYPFYTFANDLGYTKIFLIYTNVYVYIFIASWLAMHVDFKLSFYWVIEVKLGHSKNFFQA